LDELPLSRIVTVCGDRSKLLIVFLILFFQRVHTGFEWNKYNQTHYDMDNPPPKIVQGYKFNIFFPDLIDKNTTPQYFLVGADSSSVF
jgi:hypothetical protein